MKKKTQVQFCWDSGYFINQIDSIKKLYAKCMDIKDMDFLSDDDSAQLFIATVVTEIPNSLLIVPKELVADFDTLKSKYLLSTLVKKEKDSEWTRKVPDVFCALLFLMSKGVTRLTYTYQGGWDEISWDEVHPETSFHAGLPECKDYDALVNSVYAECEKTTGATATDILYGVLDDSGAGEGTTYSVDFTIDLTDFSTAMGEPEYDEAEEEEDDSF